MNDDCAEDSLASKLAAYQERLEREGSFNASEHHDVSENGLEQEHADHKRCLDLLHNLCAPRAASGPAAFGIDSEPASRPTERFQRHDELGSGGFGVVWRARDPVTGRIVALKVPRPEVLASAELRKRFEQEAEAAARLDHPNIVPILEAGADGIVPYIASVYYEGPTLARWLSEHDGHVAPRRAALIALALAKALTHAHERGVLHRDVKPSNVLLAPAPAGEDRELPFEPKLMDFGLAKLGERDQELTRTGAMLGTIKYMAPEQAAGRAKEITAATDVYGLGVVLYEMLAGAPPFSGDSDWLTLRQVLEDEPRSVSSIRRDVPRDLAVIVQKCLCKSPAQRYHSARELAEDLEHFLAGRAIVARPIPPAERLAKWCRRNPSLAALCAVVVLGTLSGVAFLSYSNMRISAALEAEKVTREELSARLYASDVRRANEALRENDIRHAQELLHRYDDIPGEKDVREFAWHFLSRRLPKQHAFTPTHPGPIYSIDLSPDEQLLATACADGRVRIWNSGKLVHEIECDSAEPNEVAFSPDGKWLVAACDDGLVRVWRTDNWRIHKSLPIGGIVTTDIEGQADRIQAIAVQENDSIVAVGSCTQGDDNQNALVTRYKSNGTIDRSFGSRGQVILWPTSGKDEAYAVVIEPDRKITVAGNRGRMDFAAARLNPDGSVDASFGKNGIVTIDLNSVRDRAYAMVRQPDGKYVLAGHSMRDGRDCAAVVRLLTSGELDPVFGDNGSQVTELGGVDDALLSVALQPDGKILAAGYTNHPGESSQHTDFVVIRYTTSGALDPTFHEDGIANLSLSQLSDAAACISCQQDGKILVAGAGEFNAESQAVVVRLNEDGTFDQQFANEGIAILDLGLQESAAQEIVAQADGNILVVGDTGKAAARSMVTARLNTDGSFDSTFGSAGRTIVQPGTLAECFTLAVTDDDKIVVGGVARCGATGPASWNLALLRLSASGSLDLSFSSNGAQGIRFSPDSSLVVSYAEQCIRFWDIAGGNVVKEAYVPRGSIESIDLSPDGARLAAACPSDVWTWNVDSLEKPRGRTASERPLTSVALLPQQELAALGYAVSDLDIYNLAANKRMLPLVTEGPLRNRIVRRSADGRWLTSVSANTATAYKTEDFSQVAALVTQGRVFDATIGPGARSILTSTVAGEVLAWPIAADRSSTLGLAGRTLYVTPGTTCIVNMAISPDGRSIACGHNDGVVRVLDAETGIIRFEVSASASEVKGVAFRDLNQIVVGYAKGTIAVVQIDRQSITEVRDLGHPIQQIAVSPDGQRLAVSLDESQIVEVLEGPAFATLCRVVHQGQGKHLAFSNSADYIVICGGAHLEVFDATKGTRVDGETQLGNIYRAVAVFPQQSRMAVAEGVNGVTIREIPSCRVVGRMAGGTQDMFWVEISPDGRNLVTAGEDDVLRIWDAGTYEPLLTFDNSPANRAYFLGRKLFVKRQQSLLVWEAE